MVGAGGGKRNLSFISRGIEWSLQAVRLFVLREQRALRKFSRQNHLDPCLKKLFAPSNLTDTV